MSNITQRTSLDSPAEILLVDDEAEFREEFALLLSRRGCRVTTAPNGTLALRELEADRRIEIIVTDLRMPGMDGLTLIDKARRSRAGSNCIGFILVTGHGDFLNLPSQVLTTGVALLQKPVAIAIFMDRLANLLLKVRQHRNAAR